MNGNAIFKLREHAVETVRCVWNMKLGIFLIRKQEGQVELERMPRGPEPPVNEVLALAEAAERVLVKKLSVALIPHGKMGTKGLFIRSCEREGDHAQLLCRNALRLSREILRDRLHLMEVAHLDRNIQKYLCYASLAVEHGGFHDPPRFFERAVPSRIHIRRLLLRLLPPEVSF